MKTKEEIDKEVQSLFLQAGEKLFTAFHSVIYGYKTLWRLFELNEEKSQLMTKEQQCGNGGQ